MRLGVGILAVGVLLLTPASDLLPVELLPFVQHPFSATQRQYLRVVPADGTWSFPTFAVPAGVLVVIGLALMASVESCGARADRSRLS
jgi:hypothetical protein